MGVGCTVGVRSGVGEVFCLDLFLLFFVVFVVFVFRFLFGFDYFAAASGRGCRATGSGIAISREGLRRCLLGRRVRVILGLALGRWEEEWDRGPRVLALQGAKSEGGIAIGGSRFAAFSFPLWAPLPLQHFRLYESQLRHGVDAVAHGQPFLRREQDDPEEHGQHESSRAVRVRIRFRGGRLRLLAGSAAAGGGRVGEGAGVLPVVPWAVDVMLVASTGSVLMKPQ